MLRLSGLLAGVTMACVLSCGGLAAAGDDSRDKNPLEPLERFVGGAWVTRPDASSANAKIGHSRVRVVYEWGINHRVMKAKSYLTGEKGDQLVYESLFYWHPEKKKVVFVSVAADGHIFDGSLDVTGEKDTLQSVFDLITAEKKDSYKQVLTFLDDNTLQWTVFVRRGDEWVKSIDMKQYRVTDAAPAKP